jgi:muramidase (phage lysozyme)
MRDAIGYLSLLDDPNVKAFLHTIRVGEGTADPMGYRRHFGGSHFDTYADHPRRIITAGLGSNRYDSSAAGAYQFLTKTWTECATALGLADFSPRNQDAAALFLIDRKRALDDVIAGRFENAVKKCAREWASLPGSPYGQPTKTMAQALATYIEAGGQTGKPTNGEAEKPTNHTEPIPAQNTPQQIQEPSEEGSGAGVPAKFNAIVAQPEATTMPAPLIPILAAVLPSLIRSIPDFGKLFSSGSEVSERNVKAVEMAVGIVQEAVGARNAQEAAEIVASDPAQAQAAQEAVRARWHELTEVGGGIESARKADVAFVEAGSNPLKSPAFLISILLLLMPATLLVDVFFVHSDAYTGELRTQIVTGVLMVIGIVGGYWLGSSFGSAKKTDLMGR